MSIQRFKQLQLDKNFMPMTLEQMKAIEPDLFDDVFSDDIASFKRRKPVTTNIKDNDFTFSPMQLDAKFKHTTVFGINTKKKNPKTLIGYQQAIIEHLEHYATKKFGRYRDDKNSVVYYNHQTMIAVVFSKGEFITAFKLSTDNDDDKRQYDNYFKNGILF